MNVKVVPVLVDGGVVKVAFDEIKKSDRMLLDAPSTDMVQTIFVLG